MRAAAIVVILLAACGDGDRLRLDAEVRPTIDPTPYEQPCDAVAAQCPAPYACVDDGTDHDDVTTCLVPCAHDSECPLGYFCNGVSQSADTGARNHCAEDV